MANTPTNPFEKRSRERRAHLQDAAETEAASTQPPITEVTAATIEASTAPSTPPENGITVWPKPERLEANAERKRILIVCTANICRSPMVGGILQQRFDQEGLGERIEIRSAGIYGLKGEPASRDGVDLLAQRDIDISNHVARAIRYEDVAEADLVIVMEEDHRKAIFVRMPEFVYKVVLFSELAGQHNDVDDPYRRGRRAYEKTLTTIDATLESGWGQLKQRLTL
jgi:protein-tyrosine phosphatase